VALAEPEIHAAALAALGISPARLRRILHGWEPAAAWAALQAGTHPEDPDGRARGGAHPALAADVARRCERLGLRVLVLGRPGYPASLASDLEAPAVLFSSGDLAPLGPQRRRVAIVGTRSASPTGLAAARAIGHTLAAAGVVVVSGLATGIDCAALTGALDARGAPAVAVLGTGHDGRAMPGQRKLRAELAGRGVVLSEQAPGQPSPRWRFVTRNRIMAALSALVVVVESHNQGGALHTVTAARRRGIPVAAVPGSVANRAADGANALLVSGARCVRHGDDVLEVLGLAAGHRAPTSGPGSDRSCPTPSLDPPTAAVLAALDPEPVDLGTVVLRAGTSVADVATALERLAQLGLAGAERGWWFRTGISAGSKRGAARATAATTARRAAPSPHPRSTSS